MSEIRPPEGDAHYARAHHERGTHAGSHHAHPARHEDAAALETLRREIELNPPRSNYLLVRGMRLHVRSWGREGARKVFLLHGWMDCSASWQFLANAFDEDWHLIAPDWRGYGLSEWGRSDTYWYADLVADLDHLKRVVDRIRRGKGVTGTKTLIVLGATAGRERAKP